MMNCTKYFCKLCLVEWENRLVENIAKLKPDIVALQEVLDFKWCEGWKEKSPKNICYRYEEREPKHQARRLLGDGYTIVCDGGANFECTGVRVGVGEVKQCPEGELCRAGEAVRAPLPEGCEDKASISAIDVAINDFEMRIVNAHPQSQGNACRGAHVRALFEGTEGGTPVASTDFNLLIMGDMNLDPYREVDDESISVWNEHVGEGKDFYYLSGPAEHDPPYKTCAGRLLDHVVTNFAKGSCKTLGEAPGTERLDGVEKDKVVPESNDHRAILCEIDMPE
ncbi:MAG: hypothetical protein ABIH66_01770 [bacterium]